MGSDFSRCFGSDADESKSPPPTANVITAAGDLHRYAVPATVSGVLAEETASSPAWFICNSDRFDYGESIPEMHADEELQADQIYFVLPRSDLHRRLSTADMAAMALKASVAIESSRSDENRRRRQRRARISPAALNISGDDVISLVGGFQKTVKSADIIKPATISRSGSVRRFQKYTSRTAKTAVKSVKLRLSTIQEGTPL